MKKPVEVIEARSVTESFPGYLSAGDLERKDHEVTVELVREPTDKDLGNNGDRITSPIVRFKNRKREMVLNITNARIARRLYGGVYDNWKGKKFILYPDTCMAWGKQSACIRIRPINPDTGEEAPLF